MITSDFFRRVKQLQAGSGITLDPVEGRGIVEISSMGGGGGSWEYVDLFAGTGGTGTVALDGDADKAYFLEITMKDHGTGGVLLNYKFNGDSGAAGQESSTWRATGNPPIWTVDRELTSLSGCDTLGSFSSGGAFIKAKVWIFADRSAAEVTYFSDAVLFTGPTGYVHQAASSKGVYKASVNLTSFTVFDLRSTDARWTIALYRARRI